MSRSVSILASDRAASGGDAQPDVGKGVRPASRESPFRKLRALGEDQLALGCSSYRRIIEMRATRSVVNLLSVISLLHCPDNSKGTLY
jgi:hypothetical protein